MPPQSEFGEAPAEFPVRAPSEARPKTRIEFTRLESRAAKADGPRQRKVDMEKFTENIQKTESCWIWQGFTLGDGYGGLIVDGKKVYAHRLSFDLHKGTIPPGMYVLHKCDVRKCVNPDHLFLGSHADNMRDKAKKGRVVKLFGERSGRAKLTESDVLQIRKAYAAGGVTQQELADQYGVTKALVGQVVRRVVWPHI